MVEARTGVDGHRALVAPPPGGARRPPAFRSDLHGSDRHPDEPPARGSGRVAGTARTALGRRRAATLGGAGGGAGGPRSDPARRIPSARGTDRRHPWRRDMPTITILNHGTSNSSGDDLVMSKLKD